MSLMHIIYNYTATEIYQNKKKTNLKQVKCER